MDYVCVSGGADSTALVLLMWERGEDFEMCFSDTGAELPEVYWFLPRLSKLVGKPLHVVSGGSFFQHLVSYGYMIPGPRIRWCTRLLKNVPQDEFFKRMNADRVAVGIRADEPRRLNRLPRGGISFYYPLAEVGMDKKDAIAMCKKYDMLNPIYEWRSNLSCFCCFFQRKSDWLGLLKHHPTLYAVAEEWEKQAFATGKQAWGWNQGYTREQLRKADQRQLKLLPEPEGEPCLICSI